MKVISYNIKDCYQWKVDKLLEMDADVWVLPESGCPEHVKLPDGYEMAWDGLKGEYKGKPYSKGLGIIWKKGTGSVPEWYHESLPYAIPLVIGDVVILAFWPTKRPERNTDKMSYPQIAQELIAQYTQYLKGKKVLVIGDFNCYVNQNDKTKAYGDVLRVNEKLEELGLQSVYHQQTGEAFGKESTPTYHHLNREDWTFFIDYAYTNTEVTDYQLLPWDSKFSDHVGQVIEVK